MKIILIENGRGEQFSFGIESLKGGVQDLFSKNLLTLTNNNKLILQQNNLSLKSLAEPETIIQPDTQAVIQLGSEIPFSKDENKTDWKFAGLKIVLKLEKKVISLK